MSIPLAEQMRPKTLSDFIGQTHLIGKNKPISIMLQKRKVTSMILWGPPGSGKTTLAKVLAVESGASFISMSAIDNTVSDLRKIIRQTEQQHDLFKNETVVFIDEIHRFNKAQQDALLPAVEKGIITFIGATTENPGFEVNAPLLSRLHVYRLYPHTEEDIRTLVKKAFSTSEIKKKPSEKVISYIVSYANGDARVAYNAVEMALSLPGSITLSSLESALQHKSAAYDKKGDNHYDTISAFIKSMRGNQPDATLHYLARMLKAGEDPMFIARRMVIFASEDIGNAQPTALVVATTCMQAVHMIGMPEASLILAQTATYLATSKKSIASMEGISAAMRDLNDLPVAPIPLHLRNAANKVMKQEGFAKGHIRYPWLEEKMSGTKVNQEYMPDNLRGRKYYKKDWE